MIKKVGNKYVLHTADGSRVLGTHDSEADARNQEIAIEIAKKKRGKK
jgi:hypothetical protein